MRSQFAHPMLPSADHDDAARQEFAAAMRLTVTANLQHGNKTAFDYQVLPAFQKECGRPPATRAEVRRAMAHSPYHQFWGALRRTTQEIVWDSVISSVAREAAELSARAGSVVQPLGSLRLDPSVAVPSYVAAVDIHCMPGNYHSEVYPGDVSQGALFDRGAWIYGMGCTGPMHDNAGWVLVNFLKEIHPHFSPRRILDIGCTVGGSTLPWCDAFPDAEVHAIDVSAPCLRYGHARAEALGRGVHFSQQNAECTDFSDGWFDLVVSCLTMHETSNHALRRIFREGWRLLGPQGIALHMDALQYAEKDPFDQYMSDWDTLNNAEPFMGTLHDLDLRALMVGAGFSNEEVSLTKVPRLAPDPGRDSFDHLPSAMRSGSLLMVAGVKS